MIVEKNSNFTDPFYYNMAGLTIEHDGVDVVTESTTSSNFNFSSSKNADRGTLSSAGKDVNVFTQISLVPRYIVVDVREDSPAALAGLKKGDEIVTVNGRDAYRIKLFSLNNLFSSRVGKRISLKFKRNDVVSKATFILKKVI
jgi:C-terminal processing protease CtpA/Prc